jgi:hypothetical protein
LPLTEKRGNKRKRKKEEEKKKKKAATSRFARPLFLVELSSDYLKLRASFFLLFLISSLAQMRPSLMKVRSSSVAKKTFPTGLCHCLHNARCVIVLHNAR